MQAHGRASGRWRAEQTHCGDAAVDAPILKSADHHEHELGPMGTYGVKEAIPSIQRRVSVGNGWAVRERALTRIDHRERPAAEFASMKIPRPSLKIVGRAQFRQVAAAGIK